MTSTELKEQALRLPVEDRLELAYALWDSVGPDPEELPLHDWQRRLLDDRLAAAERDPAGWVEWPEVERRLIDPRRRQSGE